MQEETQNQNGARTQRRGGPARIVKDPVRRAVYIERWQSDLLTEIGGCAWLRKKLEEVAKRRRLRAEAEAGSRT